MLQRHATTLDSAKDTTGPDHCPGVEDPVPIKRTTVFLAVYKLKGQDKAKDAGILLEAIFLFEFHHLEV